MELRETLKKLPHSPGIYRMLDQAGSIIYVGKAKDLKNRVSQYFQSRKDKAPKIVEMVQRIHSVDCTVMDTELDAFIEECRLIKEVKPRYNSQMKNDRNYTYIRIPSEDYPKIYIVTEKTEDNALHFGPFNSQFRVESAVRYLNEFYPVRKCTTPRLVSKPNGCLFLQLGTCSGACTGRVAPGEYSGYIDKITELLNGNNMAPVQELLGKLDECIENLEFEKAGKFREYYLGLRHVIGKQLLVQSSDKNRSILAAEFIGREKVKLFLIRGNRLLYRQLFEVSEIGSPAFAKGLAEDILAVYAAARLEKGRLTQQDVDEAQILHVYLRRNRDRLLSFWLPSSRLDRGADVLGETIARISQRIGSRLE